MPLPHQRVGLRRPSLHHPEHSNLQGDRTGTGSAHATGHCCQRETASSRCPMECVGNNWITLGSPFKGGEESKSLTYSSLIRSSAWITPSPHSQDPEGEEFPNHWKGVWRLGCREDCHTLTCCCCFWYLFLFWPFWHSKEQTNEMPKCNKRLWEVSWNSPCTSEDLNWKKFFF